MLHARSETMGRMNQAMSGQPAAPGKPEITDLGNDVFQIDTKMAGFDGITAGYLIRGSRPCLVETGTAPSAPVVRGALEAGGIGDMAGYYPGAEVVVHERGARHLADPGRLMASARMVYGDALDSLFGELAPTPAGRIRAVEETGSIDLGDGRRLDSHYSPGHAKHHVGLLDSVSGDLYVGDAAGIYLPETGDLRAATPPPDFDLDQALGSVQKFGALQPSRLLFSHYGPVDEVDETLRRSAEEILVWVDETRRARGVSRDLDHAAAMVAQRNRDRYAALRDDADETAAAKLGRLAGTPANVAGIMRWLDKSEPAAQPPAGG